MLALTFASASTLSYSSCYERITEDADLLDEKLKVAEGQPESSAALSYYSISVGMLFAPHKRCLSCGRTFCNSFGFSRKS